MKSMKSIRQNAEAKTSLRSKIGYIKINSVNGQITFSVFEVNGGGIYFKKPNIHKDMVKPSNIIHLNVDNELFLEYSPQIKQHIDMLIRMFLQPKASGIGDAVDLSTDSERSLRRPSLCITDFTLAMHKLKETVSKKPKHGNV